MPPDQESEFNFSAAMDAIAEEVLSEAGAQGEESNQETPPESGTPAPTPGTSAAAPAPAPAAPAPAPALKYPSTWKPEYASHWETLPQEVKAEVLRREDDFHRGLGEYRSAAEAGRRLQAVLEPYQGLFQEYNLDPFQTFSQLLNAHRILALGSPEEKQALWSRLARDYGIEATPGEPSFEDPALRALREEVTGLKSTLTAAQQAEQNRHREEVRKEIEAFAQNPEHDLFNQVAEDIALLIRANRELTLKEAYDRAVWQNPATRAVMLERQTKAAADAKAAEDRRRAEEAAAASKGSVRTPSRTVQSATAPKGSMDDTMRDVLKDIRNR